MAAQTQTPAAHIGELTAELMEFLDSHGSTSRRAEPIAALVARYFDEVDPEARDLYNEWLEAPNPQVLERQIEGVETIVHRPSVDELMPRPGIPA